MSLLSGLLGPAIRVASGAAAAYDTGKARSAQADQEGILQRYGIQHQQQQDQIQQVVRDRQAQMDAVKQKLMEAQTSNEGVKTQLDQYKLTHPEIDPLSPEGVTARTGLEHDKIDYDRTHGYHAPPPPAFESVPGATPDGKPANIPFNKRTGTYNPGASVGGRPPAAGGAGNDINKARLSAAGQQIANADDEMTKFEDDVRGKRAQLDALSLELARTAMANGTGSAVAMSALARHNPRLAAYVRSASEAATAERMITPRGGSNAMMQAEKILMQAGAGGNDQLIDQARAYRKTLRHAMPVDQQEGTEDPNQISNADYWEQLVNGGMSEADATKKVQARSGSVSQ